MLPLRFWQRTRRRPGMIAAQVAIMLTMLLGLLAVAFDLGMVLTVRRQTQAAADAAALAAATDLYANYDTNNGADPNGTALQKRRTSPLTMGPAWVTSWSGSTEVTTSAVPTPARQSPGAMPR